MDLAIHRVRIGLTKMIHSLLPFKKGVAGKALRPRRLLSSQCLLQDLDVSIGIEKRGGMAHLPQTHHFDGAPEEHLEPGAIALTLRRIVLGAQNDHAAGPRLSRSRPAGAAAG